MPAPMRKPPFSRIVGVPSTVSGMPACRAASLSASGPSFFASATNGPSAWACIAVRGVHFGPQTSGYWKFSPRNSCFSGDGTGWSRP